MVVQHNLRAMNSNRMLGITSKVLSKSAEKLSSGYKVNRAADDAAGLSISEKMRKQIRGLTQATLNAEDGISSVQTAEGALTEVHDMLQRMNELANKASNGTNSVSDRQTIQDEVDQLLTEIDRVSETTKFNEIYLLRGDAEGTMVTKNVNAHDAGLDGKLVDDGESSAVATFTKVLKTGEKVSIAGQEYVIGAGGASNTGALMDPARMNSDTKGYALKDKTGIFSDDVTVSVGDSYTSGGKTLKVVDKIGMDSIDWTFAADVDDAFTVGKVVVTVDQTNATDDYTEAADGNTATIGSNNVEAWLKGQIAEGKQVTVNLTAMKVKQIKEGTDATAAATVANRDAVTLVKQLKTDEIGIDQLFDKKIGALTKAVDTDKAGGTDDVDVKAGDSITLNDVTTIATDYEPAAAKSVYDSIKDLTAGGEVKIGDGLFEKTYTVVDNESDVDEAAGELTRDMIASKILDGETVKVGNDDRATVIGNIGTGGGSGKQKTIDAATAYEKIRVELQKASSIGADKGKEAVVNYNEDGTFTIKKGITAVKDALSFNLHVGADADMTNKISVNIQTMDTKGLGIQKLDVVGKDADGKNIDDGGIAATYAIDSISDAIAKVSAQRSLLGAVQNRLDHTINNLENVVENTTAAESQIRDTDMATEMVKFSNTNILAQAGQSMLAQANQANQGVLSLLG